MTTVLDQGLDAWCAVCEADTPHVVLSRHSGRVHRAQCLACRDIHLYESSAPQLKSDSAPEDEDGSGFEAVLAGRETSKVPPYEINGVYECDEIIKHPGLGIGVVIRLIGATKMEVQFSDRTMCLVCGR